jgi:hypothetical protein
VALIGFADIADYHQPQQKQAPLREPVAITNVLRLFSGDDVDHGSTEAF